MPVQNQYIEQIILSKDRRGISLLKKFLENGYCERAALQVLNNPGRVIITTGFFILAAKAPETDGPPGAVIIGKAMESIGFKVTYVTDLYCSAILKSLAGPKAEVINFPIESHISSKKHAEELINRINPTVTISVERCGFDKSGRYLNMHNKDISDYTAKLDYLFIGQENTVGIGDGGNEIGMGNLASHLLNHPSLIQSPCTTTTTELIISSVSNWGAYGLVTAMSQIVNKNLLLPVADEQALVRTACEMGAVDSMSLKPEPKVDGFNIEDNVTILESLHELLNII